MKQRQIAALLAEALGTFVLVLVVLNVSRYGLPFFTAIAAGVTITVFFSAFRAISGGHFNPAVTLGFFSIRQTGLFRAIGYIVAQVLGAVAGWQLYQYLVDRTLTNTTTPFDWRIFTAEAVGALIFSLGFVGVVIQKIKGWQAAATIGSALFLGATVAGLASNGILNPALAVGVRSFDLNYLLGPIVGFVVGALLFAYVLHPILTLKMAAPKAVAMAPAKKPARKTAKRSKK